MNARGALRATLAALALSSALASVAQAAQPVAVSCGDTITVDTKLGNDLTDCPADGLVIGADNVTLDLNGHTIDGDGHDAFDGDDNDEGVVNDAGHAGVTIKNGSVREFFEDVLVMNATRNQLRDLTVSDAVHGGVAVALSTQVRIEHNSAAGDCGGVVVFGSRDIRVEHNSFSGYTCDAVALDKSEHVRVLDNSASGVGDSAGIGLFNGSAHNLIQGNSVSDNGFVGVISEHSDDNQVTGNHIFRNGGGIIFDGDRNTVSQNHVTDTDGTCEGCGAGISFEGGRDNLIANNTVERTVAGPGISLAAFEPFTPPAIHNTARLNVVTDGGLDGILVQSTATDNLLVRNTTERNGDDGIDVENATTTLTKNKANRNHDLGIEGIPGMTDGGGNKAIGNGNPLQCTNVFCK
jgi:parallel beta-helix repeat protein